MKKIAVLAVLASGWLLLGAARDNPGQPFAAIGEQLAQILAIVTDPESGLAEIKAEIRGIEEKLDSFDETLTSGLFLIAPNAHSVDWAILNNSSDTQTFRVTVYQYPSGLPRIMVDQSQGTVGPGEVFHNANAVGTVFTAGFYTEVVVEVNSPNVQPIVEQWSQAAAVDFIPGTLIASGDFVGIKPPTP